ncbi:MAG TPA: hypothetical protein VLF14_11770 [Candidatus Binatia bacterium]|nr:hypothetical protein [Candidatus Binatia bacterium]
MIGAEWTDTLETIVVKPSGGRLSLSDVSTIIREEGGDLLGTAPVEDPAQCEAYRLRVRIRKLDDLVAALVARGHRVLTPVPEGDDTRATSMERSAS